MALESDEAYWRLVLDNRWLVKWTIKRMKVYGITKKRYWDDLVQAGTLGLCEAARAFRPEMGVKFSNLAIPMIRQAVAREIRQNTTIILPHWHYRHGAETGSSDELRAHGARVAMARPLEAAANITTPDPDTERAEAEAAAKAETVRREGLEGLRRDIEGLPPVLREELALVSQGYSLAEIGRRLGISFQASQARYKQAVGRLRDGSRLSEGIKDLPPRQRAIYELRLEGCSHAEIGTRLGISEQAARASYQLAVRRLREKT